MKRYKGITVHNNEQISEHWTLEFKKKKDKNWMCDNNSKRTDMWIAECIWMIINHNLSNENL